MQGAYLRHPHTYALLRHLLPEEAEKLLDMEPGAAAGYVDGRPFGYEHQVLVCVPLDERRLEGA
jgi:hypothetical protein